MEEEETYNPRRSTLVLSYVRRTWSRRTQEQIELLDLKIAAGFCIFLLVFP